MKVLEKAVEENLLRKCVCAIHDVHLDETFFFQKIVGLKGNNDDNVCQTFIVSNMSHL